MQVYSTLARRVVPFEVPEGRPVTMYVCGPTVQSEPHVGHGRSAVAFDVLRRYLMWRGHEVVFVRNVTDIEDKIITRAAELGTTTEAVAAESFAAFTDAYDRLGNLRPTFEPKATEHVQEMIDLITRLIDGGNAYPVEGDVYFRVRSFAPYGALSHQDLDELRVGERVDIDERKDDPLDFALWKAAKPGEPRWTSPWGEGRPGWHIECSAMASKYLGPSFDIHGGGTDLIFPHHENEIAQSEAATDSVFSRYWMHNGMLNLSGEKMAKSTGHVVELRGSLDTWDPLAVRLFFLRTHYRKPLEYSDGALADAEASLARLRSFRRRSPAEIAAEPDAETLGAFRTAMDDDLDVAGALGVLFDAVRAGNASLDEGTDVAPTVAAFDTMMSVLGLDTRSGDDASIDLSAVSAALGVEADSIDDLLRLRDVARSERDWQRADEIRDALDGAGIVIEDTPDGARWHRS